MYKNHKPICTICKRVLLIEDEALAREYRSPDKDSKYKTYYVCKDCNIDYEQYLHDEYARLGEDWE